MSTGFFPSSVFFFNFFFNVLFFVIGNFCFSLLKCLSQGKFLPRYLGFVCGYCELDCFLGVLMYRDATDFYLLILNPSTLLKLSALIVFGGVFKVSSVKNHSISK